MTSKKTEEEVRQERIAEKAEHLLEEVFTNKDKRDAVNFFDTPFPDLDNLDMMVVVAYLACERKQSLAELDSQPSKKLEAVILGE